MGGTRQNTLVVDFSVLPARPNTATVQKFLQQEIKLDMTTVKVLQLHSIRKQALIEFCNLEVAENLAASHHLKHSMIIDSKKFLIPVFMEDSAINIRVHDLPPDIPNVDVAEHMAQYGKVKSVVREVWKKYFPGTPNGVRVVRIELKQHIPSYVRIKDQMTSVTYRNQPVTCQHCNKLAHPNVKCSEATKASNQHQHIETGPPQLQKTQLPPPAIDNNKQADNGKEAIRETKRKRDQSSDTQLSGVTEMEITTAEPEADKDKMTNDEWYTIQNKKLDRIFARNKESLRKCDLVLNSK